ncbi:MAG: class I SAM-dependent methyltransferase, partial [Proteobacteria bacterium]|nr:class I SAM-dependent methyltransferase [Pseudomonadota bacterium]
LKALRGAHGFGSRNPLGAMLAKVFGYPPIVHFLKRIAAKTSWRILDVGCGLGIALRDLGFAGFAALDGVDPHLDRTKSIGSVKLFKMDFSEVTETYDLVIFNHSFEHMLNQLEVLTQAAHVLADDGWLLIRMPVVGKSWRQYKCDWFCLHAPRHFSIHTLKSFHKQLLRSPFEIVYLDFDSDWNHNLSSKKYALDIPNSDPRYLKNTGLLPKDFEDAKSEALLANQLGEGDQASFYLRKKSAKLNSGKSPA